MVELIMIISILSAVALISYKQGKKKVELDIAEESLDVINAAKKVDDSINTRNDALRVLLEHKGK